MDMKSPVKQYLHIGFLRSKLAYYVQLKKKKKKCLYFPFSDFQKCGWSSSIRDVFSKNIAT